MAKGKIVALFKPNINKLKQRKDFAGLIRATEYDSDDQIRRQAIETLGKLCSRYPEKLSEDVLFAIFNACRDENSGIRAQAVYALGEIGDLRGLEYIIRATDDTEKGVRVYAVRALGKIGNERARKILLTMLNTNKHDVQKQVIQVLGDLSEQRAVQPLLQLFERADGSTQRLIMDVLANFDSPETIEYLVELLKSDYNSRRYAVLALERLGWSPETLGEKINYLIARGEWDVLKNIGMPALGPLIDTFQYNDKSNKEVTELIYSMGTAAVDRFILSTEERDNQFRENAFSALAQMGNIALKRLEIALQSDDFFIRNFAANALKKFGPRAVPIVLPHLKNPDGQIRVLASQILEANDWEPKTDIEKTYFLIAKGAWERLAKIGKPTTKHLLYALKNFDEKTNVIKTLVKIGDERAIDTFISLLDDKEHAYIARSALISFGNKAIEKVLEGLDESSSEYRLNATVIMGVVADENTIEILRVLLLDVNKPVRIAAIIALGNIAKKLGRTDVLKDIVAMLGSDDPLIRKTVIDVLGKLHLSNTISIVSQYLTDDSPKVRKAASQALLLFDKEILQKHLRALFSEGDIDIRKRAALLFKKIGYQPENLPEKIDYFLLTGNRKKLSELSEEAIPYIIQRLVDDSYFDLASHALASMGEKGIDYIAPYLDTDDENLRSRIYKILSIIINSIVASSDLGEYYLSDENGMKSTKEPWEYIGKYRYFYMDCPLCGDCAMKNKPIEKIAKKCAENGYASFKCSSCGKVCRIPISIFPEDFQMELTANPEIATKSLFERKPLFDTLSWDWPRRIYEFNMIGRKTINKIQKQRVEFEEKYHEWIDKNIKTDIPKEEVETEPPSEPISKTGDAAIEILDSEKKEENTEILPQNQFQPTRKSIADEYKGTWRHPSMKDQEIEIKINPENLNIFEEDTASEQKGPILPWRIENDQTILLKAVVIIANTRLDQERIQKVVSNSVNIWDFANYDENDSILRVLTKQEKLKKIKELFEYVSDDELRHYTKVLKNNFSESRSELLSIFDSFHDYKFKNILIRVGGGVALVIGISEIKEEE